MRFIDVIIAAGLVGGCTDLSEFRTGTDRVFRGAITGTESPEDCAMGPCSFIRRGLATGTELELTFDPEVAATSSVRSPGTLHTNDDRCGGPTLDGVPLLPIDPLAHDQLSLYEFPGIGRIQNYIFSVQPTSGVFAGREVMAFVSLVRGGRVDLRLIAGTGRDCDPTDCAAFSRGECDLFGVFSLKKEPLVP